MPIETDKESGELTGIAEELMVQPSSPFSTILSALGFDMTSAEIDQWLLSDELDPGYNHLDDDEIVTEILEPTPDEEPDDGNDETCMSISDHNPDAVAISHGNAFGMLTDCLKWLQQQDEATPYNIANLRSLRNLAAKKRLSSLEQTRVSHYFQ